MKTMHLFAGAGGGLLCDLILGHEPIVAVEWDTYCCRVLRERAADGWFPSLHVWEGDVRLFDPSEYAGRVDSIHAGFPCTDISRAGNQAGVGEGTRSGLYREVLRIADIVRPRYLFLENVAAILANEFLGTVLGDMAARGYDARWTCVPASAAGAGHYRDRWWLLADNADVDDTRELQPQGSKQNEWRWPDHAAKNATDTMCARLQVGSRKSTAETIPYIWAPSDMVSGEGSGTSATPWFAVEPDVGPLVYGLADDMVPGAIKALGNAQVPLQAALAWMMLGGAIDSF